jgi:hypothetical protein
VPLVCSILGSGFGGDANKLSSNISSEEVDINVPPPPPLHSVCCTEFFETKFELENVTKRSYVKKQMCEV